MPWDQRPSILEFIRSHIATDKSGMAEDGYLGRSEWLDRVRAKLSSEDEVEFAYADQAAKALGIDTWDIHPHVSQSEGIIPLHLSSFVRLHHGRLPVLVVKMHPGLPIR